MLLGSVPLPPRLLALFQQEAVRRDNFLFFRFGLLRLGRNCPLSGAQRRLIDRQIKFACARAAALGMLYVLLCHMVDQHLGRVWMLTLRLVILHARAIADGRNNTAQRHIQRGDQLHRQRTQQQNDRAHTADDQLKQLCGKARQHAAGGKCNAAVPKLCDHVKRPFRMLLIAHQMHQRADGQRKQKCAAHTQPDRPPVMQQQNHKRPDKRKRQYVQAASDQAAKKRREQIQKRRIHTEAAQYRKHAQKQADHCADLTPDGRFFRRGLFPARRLLPCPAAARGRRSSRFLLFSSCHNLHLTQPEKGSM